MTELHLYPVEDPQNLLPDANTYTCMLQYRTPGTLPTSGRFATYARVNATETSPSVPEQFSIVQPNGETWFSTDRQMFYDALAHSKVFSRDSRAAFFTWLCNTSRLNSYFFVVVHQLYATRDESGDDAELLDEKGDAGDEVLRLCLKRRADRRQRQGKTRPLSRAVIGWSSCSNDEETLGEPCGSLVSIYLNDPQYVDLAQDSAQQAEMFIAVTAFQHWFSLIEPSMRQRERGESDLFLFEPPDVFTDMPLRRALHERPDVSFNLSLYDFQSRTAHWMKRVEDDEIGIKHRLSLKSSKDEWFGSAHKNLQYYARNQQLVLGQSLDAFPYTWMHNAGDIVRNRAKPLSFFSSTTVTDKNEEEAPNGRQQQEYIPPNRPIAEKFASLFGDAGKATRLQQVVENRKQTSVSIRGGIICDATGTGKTVETLGLFSLQSTSDRNRVLQSASQSKHYAGIPRWRLPPHYLDSKRKKDVHPFYFCAATLVVCPKQVCQQWIDQLTKACGANSFRALLIMKTDDARKVSLSDVLYHYDIVVINKSVFSQIRYREIVVRIPKPVVGRMGWNEESCDVRFPSLHRTGPFEYCLKNDYIDEDSVYNTTSDFHKTMCQLLALNHAATVQAPDLAPPGSFFPHFHAGLCYWRRVIFDEVHELDQRWRLVERAACSIRSEQRWGLTATPTFNSPMSFGVGMQGGYLSLMRMARDEQRHFRRAINRWQFVQKYTRRSGFVGMVPLHVRRVEVQMTPQEMSIYQSLDSVSLQTMLEFCCHHDISDDAWLRSFLPERVYRRHFDPSYVGEDENKSLHQIEPHTVEEIVHAMQSARNKKISSLEQKTSVALAAWMRQEEQFAEFIRQEIGSGWAETYRSSMWWLDTFHTAERLLDITTKTDQRDNDHNGDDAQDDADASSSSVRREAGDEERSESSLTEKKRRVPITTAKQKLLAAKKAAETDKEKDLVLVEEHQQNRRTVRRQILAFLDNFGTSSVVQSSNDQHRANSDLERQSETNSQKRSSNPKKKARGSSFAEKPSKRARRIAPSEVSDDRQNDFATEEEDDEEEEQEEKEQVPTTSNLSVSRMNASSKRSQFTVWYTSQSNAFKALSRDLEALDRVRRQHQYYERIFELLNNESSITCAICLDDIPREETVLTQCGHQFCMDCIDACGNDRVRAERQKLQSELLRGHCVADREMTIRCAQCRTQLRVLHDLKVIDRTATVGCRQAEAQTETQQEQVVEERRSGEQDQFVQQDMSVQSRLMRDDFSKYGSKIKCILEEIWNIQSLPDAKKIIVFAQSHHLLHLIGRGLESFGLPFVYVEGRNSQQNIDRFRKDARIRVILLSSEERKGSQSTISGLDLPEANYIIAAHPPMGSDEACYQTMKQAIGRIVRIGQTSDCHLLVMTTRNTIEETLYDNWNAYAQQRDRECGENVRQLTAVSQNDDMSDL